MDREAPIITSSGNSIIKRTRSLLRRKGRYEERAFLIEGVRAVFDALASQCPVDLVLLRMDVATPDMRARIPAHVPVRVVEANVFDAVSDVAQSQGIMALISMDSLPRARRELSETAPLIVIADGVRDPGNLGTLLRSAAGGGATLVLLTPQTVDPFNPKTVRAAMGAHFRVSIASCGADDLGSRLRSVPTIALADAMGTDVYTDIDWTGGCALIVGGEADGASAPVRKLATTSVRIPLSAHIESLNAGVAGSLLIFEAARQRRHA